MPESLHHVERTCVVCRKQRHADELLPLGLVDRCVVFRPKAAARRAYVCIQTGCLAGLTAKALSRAFDTPATFDPDAFLSTVRDYAAGKVLATLGLARRTGVLEVGTDRVLHDPPPETFTVVASDLAPRTLNLAARTGAHVFSDQDELGRATGIPRAGALAIRPGRLANDAHYWLRLWQSGSAKTPNANTTT